MKKVTVITPSNVEKVMVSDTMTISELKRSLDLSSGFVATSAGFKLEDDALVSKYDRVSFGADTKDGV